MIRVTALTSGRDVPSARYRFAALVGPLESRGVAVRLHAPAVSRYAGAPLRDTGSRGKAAAAFLEAKAWTMAKLAAQLPGVMSSRWATDLVWLERQMIPGRYTLERALPRPLVVDVDDAIWLAGDRRAAERLAARADVLVAGNSFLADWFSSHGARRVEVVPTGVDLRLFAAQERRSRGTRRVGWIGTSSNLPYLESLSPILERIRRELAANIVIISDRPPGRNFVQHEWIRWSPANEVAMIQSFDVGLMPLDDSDWARGKCSFKLLQYLAAGVAAVASPVGMNREVLALGGGLAADDPDQWYAQIEGLLMNQELRDREAGRGRAVIERHFSVDVIASRLATLFEKIT